MDSLYRTPLLDCFRRGEVAPDIRMMAAQGVLAPRAHEQLGLLVLLAGDADPAVRAATESTLQRIPTGDLARFLGREDVAPEIVAFFEKRGIQPEPAVAAVTDEPLLDGGGAAPAAREAASAGADGEDAAGLHSEGVTQRLALMTVSEKIKAAMRGSREERSILIRDPNKIVAFAVLSSPKVSEQDVEGFAKMASLSEDVLRVIGMTRAWSKSYSIVRALAFNPKSPIAVSMTLVNRLVEKDVRLLAADRNIAEPVKVLARKAVQGGQARRG
jgi:hypothetical protein